MSPGFIRRLSVRYSLWWPWQSRPIIIVLVERYGWETAFSILQPALRDYIPLIGYTADADSGQVHFSSLFDRFMYLRHVDRVHFTSGLTIVRTNVRYFTINTVPMVITGRVSDTCTPSSIPG